MPFFSLAVAGHMRVPPSVLSLLGMGEDAKACAVVAIPHKTKTNSRESEKVAGEVFQKLADCLSQLPLQMLIRCPFPKAESEYQKGPV